MQRMFAASIFLAICLSPVWAELKVEQVQKLVHRYGNYTMLRFAEAVALDGSTAVIGTRYGSDFGGSHQEGIVDVYGFQDGMLIPQSRLTASDRGGGEWFGHSVAIDGDTIVVGAPRGNTGAVYVFVRQDGSWVQEAKLIPDDGERGDFFGVSVAIRNNTIVVGSFDNDAGFLAGSAYIYSRQNDLWTQTAKLTAADASSCDMFGRTVVLGDGIVMIHGRQTFDARCRAPHTRTGSVFVFEEYGGRWVQTQHLLPDDVGPNALFGTYIALAGDTALISAHNDDHAYVFSRQRGVWMQEAKLSGESTDARFGGDVALHDDTAIVGSYYYGEDGAWLGSPYVFNRKEGRWNRDVRFQATDLQGGSFGSTYQGISFDGENVLIGAPYQEIDGKFQAGAAYLFRLACSLEATLDIKPDSPHNPINPKSKGVIPAVILGSAEFDVTTIDPSALRFGPDGAALAHDEGHLVDLNLDGYLDLLQHYPTQDTGIACGDEGATVTGETLDGCEIVGTDSIRTVGNCR
jgi:hypothetical protein